MCFDKLDLGEQLIRIVMSCLASSRLSVLWNEKCLEEFKPERGLRQGDPLSLYLFVLCMEVLGGHIKTALEGCKWKTCVASKGGPKISHLFFVDDLLLFGETSKKQAQIIIKILHGFCEFGSPQIRLLGPNSRSHLSYESHKPKTWDYTLGYP